MLVIFDGHFFAAPGASASILRARHGERGTGLESAQASVAQAAACDLFIGLESLPLAACLCDRDGALLGSNRKAAGLFGMLQPGMRFWSLPGLLQPDGRPLSTASAQL